MELFRLVSIDPGTTSLGLVTMDLVINRGNSITSLRDSLILTDVRTIDVVKEAKAYPYIEEVHGFKMAKLHAITQYLSRHLHQYQPSVIVSESPYLDRFPAAYAALTECLFAIRNAIFNYCPHIPLNTIDPSTIKKSVGVSGKSGDKDLMALAVRELSKGWKHHNQWNDYLEIADEHSIDAVAVGICYLLSNHYMVK